MAKIVGAPHPRPSPDVVKAAREAVKKAMVSRALAVAAQCKIVVDAMAALEKLQREVEDVDVEGCSCYCAAEEIGVLSDAFGSFVPDGVNGDFKAVGRTMEVVRLNALRLAVDE